MISRLSIKMRLTLLMFVTAFGACLVAVIGLYSLRAQMIEDRLAQMSFIMDSTLSIGRAAMTAAGGKDTDTGRAAFISSIRAVRFGPPEEQNYAFGYYYNGVGFAHLNPKRIGLNALEGADKTLVASVSDSLALARSPEGRGFKFYISERGTSGPKVPKVGLVQNVPELNGFVGIGLYIDDIESLFWHRAVASGAIFLVLMLVTTAIAYGVNGSITRPLGRLTSNMTAIAAGDTAVEVTGTGANTEIGAFARALEIFRQNVIERSEALQREHLEDERRTARARKIETLNQGFDHDVTRLLTKVEQAVVDFQSTSQMLSSTAEDTNGRVASVAAASERSSANVRSAAAATEELTASVNEIGEQVRNSSAIANRAVMQARSTNDQIAGLAEATGRIGEVVKLITDIASQTNLLALNATIEAARAGDAGRGFAVVASEVKNLATQTGRATEEIAGQISAIQHETRQAVDAIQAIASTIEEIDRISASVAQSVNEQKLATNEIAINAQVAAEGTNDVTQTIGKVADAAKTSEQTSRQLSIAANDLQTEAHTLRSAVQAFLAEVKAA